ncbi:MAG TPA: ATP-binding protein [Bryobacteraceae bacterium]
METDCAICGGTGWKIVERAGLSGAKRCECAAASRMRTIRRNTGIPPNYEHASLDNFVIPGPENPIARSALATVRLQVSSFVREFPAADRLGLLLVGDTGTGKTHLAVAALKSIVEKGYEGLFFDYQNLLDRIRAGFDSASGSSDREAYRSALDAQVLLLDDLGSHRVTDWVEDTVTSIITYRCNHRKPLIATTNLPIDDVTGRVPQNRDSGGIAVSRRSLAEVIGIRACSRLFEMCRVIKMPATEDYRVQTRLAR